MIRRRCIQHYKVIPFLKRQLTTNQNDEALTVNSLLYDVYQDKSELEHYRNALRFEIDELYDLDTLDINKKALLQFSFGPDLKIFKTDHLSLANSFGGIYSPIDLKNTNFLTLLKARYKVMQNPRKEYIRNLTRLEYLGKFVFREYTFRLFLLQLQKSEGSFFRMTKLVKRNIVTNKTIDMDLYFQFQEGKPSFSAENILITSRISNNRIKTIHSFYIYMGLKYLENKTQFKLITIEILKDLGFDKINYFITKDIVNGNIINDETLLLRKISKRIKFYIPKNIQTNPRIFSSIVRPKLLPYKSTRLPPLPKLAQPEYSHDLLKLALLNPYSSVVSVKNIARTKKMSDALDAYGDIVLKRVSFEFFLTILENDINHISIFTDHLFMNSNLLFGRLAEIYELDKGLNSINHHEELKDNLRYSMEINREKTIFELYGDLFERVVAVFYLDNPNACQKWLFEIFQLIYLTLLIDKHDGKILDKEYFQASVKKESFKEFKFL